MNFVGFRVSWRKAKSGKYRPWARPRSDRKTATLIRIRKYLHEQLTCSNHMVVLKKLAQVVIGWVNYFAISDSDPYVQNFIGTVRVMVHRWLNRRGKKGSMNWKRLDGILAAANFRQNFKTRSLFTVD